LKYKALLLPVENSIPAKFEEFSEGLKRLRKKLKTKRKSERRK
jgi:hypothetical protein